MGMQQSDKRWHIEDLEVFKRAYALSLDIHRASLDFPKIEQFGGLADQLRRASKSVCALMAEGSGRQAGSAREFARYLHMAVGSAEEARLLEPLWRRSWLYRARLECALAGRIPPCHSYAARAAFQNAAF